MTSDINRSKSARLESFSARSRGETAGVFLAKASDWKYVPVHPFADDLEQLSRLGITAEQCQGVDAYVNFGEDVFFFQVNTQTKSLGRRPGHYARLSPGKPPYVNIVAIIADDVVEKPVFEAELEAIREANIMGIIRKACETEELVLVSRPSP